MLVCAYQVREDEKRLSFSDTITSASYSSSDVMVFIFRPTFVAKNIVFVNPMVSNVSDGFVIGRRTINVLLFKARLYPDYSIFF